MKTDPFKTTVLLVIAVLLLSFWAAAIRVAITILGAIQ